MSISFLWILACSSGTWGKGCSETCVCSHFASGCDGVTGSCDCLDGYTGSLCDQGKEMQLDLYRFTDITATVLKCTL